MRCTSSDWDGADPQYGVANLSAISPIEGHPASAPVSGAERPSL